jgi:hypothetical protein
MNDGMPGMNNHCYTEAIGHPANRNCSSGSTKQQRAPANSKSTPPHQRIVRDARVPKRRSPLRFADFPNRNHSHYFYFLSILLLMMYSLFDITQFSDVSCLLLLRMTS